MNIFSVISASYLLDFNVDVHIYIHDTFKIVYDLMVAGFDEIKDQHWKHFLSFLRFNNDDKSIAYDNVKNKLCLTLIRILTQYLKQQDQIWNLIKFDRKIWRWNLS